MQHIGQHHCPQELTKMAMKLLLHFPGMGMRH